MAIHLFKTADGKVHEIDAPDDMRVNEVADAFAQFMAPKGEAAPAPKGRAQQEIEDYQNQTVGDQRAKASQGATFQIGPFDTGISMPQGVDETLAGMGRRFSNIFTAGNAEEDEQANKQLDDSGYATAGSVLADIAAMTGGGKIMQAAATGGKIGNVISAAGKALSTPNSLGKAAATGAAYEGVTQRGDTVQERLENAAFGGFGGGLGFGLADIAGRAVAPQVTRSAQKLLDKNVPLTPGQMLGGNINKVEQQLSSIPVAGDFVSNARLKGLESWNKSEVNSALKHIGKQLPKDKEAGTESFSWAADKISKQYDKILNGVDVTPTPRQLASLPKVPKGWDTWGADNQRIYTGYVDDFTERLENGTISARDFKGILSELTGDIAKTRKSPDVATARLGRALTGVRDDMLDMLGAKDSKIRKQLAKADKANAIMMSRGEASIAGAANELFTPAQLKRKLHQRSGKKSAFTGNAPGLGGVASAAEVLPSTVPDSGTAGRGMLGLLAAGAFDPTLGLMAAAGTLPYTKIGGDATRAYMQAKPWRAGLRQGFQGAAPYTGLLGTAYSQEER